MYNKFSISKKSLLRNTKSDKLYIIGVRLTFIRHVSRRARAIAILFIDRPVHSSHPSLSSSHGVVSSLAQLAKMCNLALFLTVIGRCIALDGGGVDVFPLHSDLH